MTEFEKLFNAAVDRLMPQVTAKMWKVFCVLLGANEPLTTPQIAAKVAPSNPFCSVLPDMADLDLICGRAIIKHTKSMPIRYAIDFDELEIAFQKRGWL